MVTRTPDRPKSITNHSKAHGTSYFFHEKTNSSAEAMVHRRSFLRFVMSFAIMTCTNAFGVVLHRAAGKHRIIDRTATLRFQRLLSSSLSSTRSASSDTDQSPCRPARQNSNTGGLRRLPVVKAPNELMSRAGKTARLVKADRYGDNDELPVTRCFFIDIISACHSHSSLMADIC